MTSTRKDEIKNIALDFFPKVLTSIITDYSESKFTELELFITANPTNNIAKALLNYCENASINLENYEQTIRFGIAFCYMQNYYLIAGMAKKSIEDPMEIINAHSSTDNETYTSLVMPISICKPRNPRFTFTPQRNQVDDPLHEILVTLYTQFGGKTKENNLKNNALDHTDPTGLELKL